MANRHCFYLRGPSYYCDCPKCVRDGMTTFDVFRRGWDGTHIYVQRNESVSLRLALGVMAEVVGGSAQRAPYIVRVKLK